MSFTLKEYCGIVVYLPLMKFVLAFLKMLPHLRGGFFLEANGKIKASSDKELISFPVQEKGWVMLKALLPFEGAKWLFAARLYLPDHMDSQKFLTDVRPFAKAISAGKPSPTFVGDFGVVTREIEIFAPPEPVLEKPPEEEVYEDYGEAEIEAKATEEIASPNELPPEVTPAEVEPRQEEDLGVSIEKIEAEFTSEAVSSPVPTLKPHGGNSKGCARVASVLLEILAGLPREWKYSVPNSDQLQGGCEGIIVGEHTVFAMTMLLFAPALPNANFVMWRHEVKLKFRDEARAEELFTAVSEAVAQFNMRHGCLPINFAPTAPTPVLIPPAAHEEPRPISPHASEFLILAVNAAGKGMILAREHFGDMWANASRSLKSRGARAFVEAVEELVAIKCVKRLRDETLQLLPDCLDLVRQLARETHK